MTLDDYRRQEFSAAVAEGIYLNHAGVSPSPTRVVRAVQEAMDTAGRAPHKFFMENAIPAMEGARAALSRLMGVPAEHLALTKNTGHGLSIIADGLSLESGDNVVTADCEYPAVVYPWYAQSWRGIETRLVSPRPDGTVSLDDIAGAMDERTRVLALSWVQFGMGFQADMAACAELAHARGALLVADVIQGLGALPCRAGEWGLDVVASGAHKWLMAPAGTGGLYIAPHVLDRMHLVNMGAASVVDVVKFDSTVFQPKPTAQRYEEGSPNGIGLIGLNAALSLLEEVGIDRIAARVLSLTALAAEALQSKGYRVMSPLAEGTRSGLILFRHPRHTNESLMQALTEARVTAAVRGGSVRFSPHFYNTPDEITRAVEALPD